MGASGRGGSAGSSGTAGRRSGRSGGPAPEGFAATLCAFWLGEQCFAIAAGVVGEVVPVEALTPVPLAAQAVRGLFNLRGTPVAALDLGLALALPDVPSIEGPRPGHPLTALVIRSGDLIAGALIRRMEVVIPAGRGRFRPRGESPEESLLVAGFLEFADHLVITVLAADELIERLTTLRLRRGADAEDRGE